MSEPGILKEANLRIRFLPEAIPEALGESDGGSGGKSAELGLG